MDGSNRAMTLVMGGRCDAAARVVAQHARVVLERNALRADGVLKRPAPAVELLTPEQKIAQLAPGQRSSTMLPGGRMMSVIGRVPNDRSTRQQRRAAARGK